MKKFREYIEDKEKVDQTKMEGIDYDGNWNKAFGPRGSNRITEKILEINRNNLDSYRYFLCWDIDDELVRIRRLKK